METTTKVQGTEIYLIPDDSQEHLKSILDNAKGEVVKQLELLCPSERSFNRAKKNMHNIFDDLQKKLQAWSD